MGCISSTQLFLHISEWTLSDHVQCHKRSNNAVPDQKLRLLQGRPPESENGLGSLASTEMCQYFWQMKTELILAKYACKRCVFTLPQDWSLNVAYVSVSVSLSLCDWLWNVNTRVSFTNPNFLNSADKSDLRFKKEVVESKMEKSLKGSLRIFSMWTNFNE